MSSTVDTTNLQNVNEDAQVTAKKNKAAQKASGGRQKTGSTAKPTARPYKKLEDDILGVRISTMKKRIAVLESKAIILKDRLELHVAEEMFRETKKKDDSV